MQRFGPSVIRRGGTSPAAESRVLKAKGLPWRLSEAELCNFFQDYALLRVVLLPTADGRPSGMAFAEFETAEEAIRAMNSRNGDFIGDRYVKLLRVPYEEMEEQTAGLLPTPAALCVTTAAAAVAALNFQALGISPHNTYSVEQQAQQQQQMQQLQQLHQVQQLRGLQHQQEQQEKQTQQLLQPNSATSDPPVSSSHVLLHAEADHTEGNNGSRDHAPAVSSAGPVLSGTVDTTSEFGWNPMRNGPQPFLGNGAYPGLFNSPLSFPPGNGFGANVWAPSFGRLELPDDAGDKPIAVLIAEQQEAIRSAQRAAVAVAAATATAAPPYQQALNSSQLFQQQQQQSLQQTGAMQLSQLQTHQQTMLPAPFHQQFPLINHQVGNTLQGAGRHGISPAVGSVNYMMHGMPFSSRGFAGSHAGDNGDAHIPSQRLVRADGSTVKMRGLPFRATTDEILQFFHGFKIVAGSLHLGSDGRGRPSGEGWLTFETAEEAKAVAKAKNKQFMGKRYLELSLC